MGSLLEWEVLSIKQRCGTLTPELKYCQCANVTEVWETQLLRCAGHGWVCWLLGAVRALLACFTVEILELSWHS